GRKPKVKLESEPEVAAEKAEATVPESQATPEAEVADKVEAEPKNGRRRRRRRSSAAKDT
ncbi:MAG: hypothetical protein AAFR63_10390, partial [Cyanobacteria bacterium J06631_6]